MCVLAIEKYSNYNASKKLDLTFLGTLLYHTNFVISVCCARDRGRHRVQPKARSGGRALLKTIRLHLNLKIREFLLYPTFIRKI